MQERRNSSALAMELHLSCINPLIYYIFSNWLTPCSGIAIDWKWVQAGTVLQSWQGLCYSLGNCCWWHVFTRTSASADCMAIEGVEVCWYLSHCSPIFFCCMTRKSMLKNASEGAINNHFNELWNILDWLLSDYERMNLLVYTLRHIYYQYLITMKHWFYLVKIFKFSMASTAN